jgi:hypothetical protein
MHGHATLLAGATGASAHWAPKRLSVPKSTRKERSLRTSSWCGSIARTHSNAGIPRLLERFRSMTENRGVPGSSPGLAIGSAPNPAWLRDSLVVGVMATSRGRRAHETVVMPLDRVTVRVLLRNACKPAVVVAAHSRAAVSIETAHRPVPAFSASFRSSGAVGIPNDPVVREGVTRLSADQLGDQQHRARSSRRASSLGKRATRCNGVPVLRGGLVARHSLRLAGA